MAYQASKQKKRPVVEFTPPGRAGSVTNDEIAEDAITTAKVKDGTIRGEDIAPQTIETGNIKDNAITKHKIGIQQVEADNVAPRAITQPKVAAGAIGTSQIKDYSVTQQKLGPASVTQDKLAPDVGAAALGVDSVDTPNIRNAAITNEKIFTDAVTATKIRAGAVGTSEIAAGAVTASECATGLGIFIPRALAAPDKTLVDFLLNGILQVDGLDLSAIVPAGAVAVQLVVRRLGSGSVEALDFMTNQTTHLLNRDRRVYSGATEDVYNFTIAIDPDGLLDYLMSTSGAPTALEVSVAGWYI